MELREERVEPVETGTILTEDGARLYYERYGEGGQALVVPNAVYLADSLSYLARGRVLIAYDLRNRGRSEALHERRHLERGVEHDVEDIEAVRRHFGLERFALLGHSYVGLVVVLYAARHPGRVERLVQIGSVAPKAGTVYPPELNGPPWAAVVDAGLVAELRRRRDSGEAERDPEGYAKLWWAVMGRMLVGNPEHVGRMDTEVWRYPNELPTHVERHFAESIWPSLLKVEMSAEDCRRIDLPVLVIHGTSDRNAPYGAGRDWALRLPEARLLTVAGAGHVPWLEAPDLVRPALEAFLAGRWPEQAEEVKSLVPAS
jgi:proline iminopeptidase